MEIREGCRSAFSRKMKYDLPVSRTGRSACRRRLNITVIEGSEEAMMILKKLSETRVMDNAHGVDARNLYDKSDAVIAVITLEPGQALKRHITPVDVAFYVLEGTGIVEIGEERAEVSEDTLIESPADVVHCWYNESGRRLRFMVIKAPRPKAKTVFVSG